MNIFKSKHFDDEQVQIYEPRLVLEFFQWPTNKEAKKNKDKIREWLKTSGAYKDGLDFKVFSKNKKEEVINFLSEICIKTGKDGLMQAQIDFAKKMASLRDTNKKPTYVHENVFPTNIHPWFKEHDIEDSPVSPPSNNVYPKLVANGYDQHPTASMVVPVVMVVGIFIGTYVYRKFMKKTPTKKNALQK